MLKFNMGSINVINVIYGSEECKAFMLTFTWIEMFTKHVFAGVMIDHLKT